MSIEVFIYTKLRHARHDIRMFSTHTQFRDRMLFLVEGDTGYYIQPDKIPDHPVLMAQNGRVFTLTEVFKDD